MMRSFIVVLLLGIDFRMIFLGRGSLGIWFFYSCSNLEKEEKISNLVLVFVV